MARIAMTGENGFLGKHLTRYLSQSLDHEVVYLGRNYLLSADKLRDLDYLIHGASVHRHPNPELVYQENMKIHTELLSALTDMDARLNIVYLSSIQETMPNAYGRSKWEGKELFKRYTEAVDRSFMSFTLPNLFGPDAIPNRTSFIATFCYNLHNNIGCSYNSNMVQLCYVDDAVKEISKLEGQGNFNIFHKQVDEVYLLLEYFNNEIKLGKEPVTHSYFEEKLLYTFNSYKNFLLN